MVRDYGRKLYTIMAVSFIITILFSGAAMAQEAAKAGQQKEAQKDEMKGDQKSDQKSEIKGELQIPEERRYVVKEGDTLWDISNNTLKDPFLWPRLWKDNKYIINPDLIYPGNIIMFPGEDKGIPSAPTAEAPKAAAPEQRPGEAPQPVMGEAAAPPPAVEEEVIAEAPAAVEETKERPIAIGGVGVLTDEVLLFSSGLIVPKLENKGVIIGSWDKKVLLGEMTLYT